MDEIELKLHDMSSTLQPVDAYALVLEEVNGNRKLPIIIGSLEAKAIRIKMLDYKLPRPWTHDLFLSLTEKLEEIRYTALFITLLKLWMKSICGKRATAPSPLLSIWWVFLY